MFGSPLDLWVKSGRQPRLDCCLSEVGRSGQAREVPASVRVAGRPVVSGVALEASGRLRYRLPWVLRRLWRRAAVLPGRLLAVEGQRLTGRTTCASGRHSNRLLCLRGASVIDVSFAGEGVIVTVRLRRRRRVCACCGQTGRRLKIHERGVKRWRHLDLGATRCVIECELRLLRCPDCRVVRFEPVPWARPDAHHTRDFEEWSRGWPSRWPRPRSRGCPELAGIP
jgi:hypothetical protein